MKGGGVTWELVHWSDTGTLTDDFLGFMIPAPSSPHCVPFCQLPKHLAQIMGLYLRAFHVKFFLAIEYVRVLCHSNASWTISTVWPLPYSMTFSVNVSAFDWWLGWFSIPVPRSSLPITITLPLKTLACVQTSLAPSEKNREKIFFWGRGTSVYRLLKLLLKLLGKTRLIFERCNSYETGFMKLQLSLFHLPFK